MGPSRDLDERLGVFRDAGLLQRVPTHWQLFQGGVEMTPFVLSDDATDESAYAGAPLGHPLLRQPLLVAWIGRDHFATGSGLRMRLRSICRHLQLTIHQGMPVFDLQIVQTHPGGLDFLRATTEALLVDGTPTARRQNWIARRILPAPAAYYRQFLGPDGWIARAERFDYPGPDDAGSAFPPEFWSLVAFADSCARRFPERPGDVGLRVPIHLAHLATRRLREGRRMGWFAREAA